MYVSRVKFWDFVRLATTAPAIWKSLLAEIILWEETYGWHTILPEA